jgi:hypothetical protein
MTGPVVFIDGSRLANAFQGLGLFRPIAIKKLLKGILDGNDAAEVRLYVSLPPEAIYPQRRSDLKAWAQVSAAEGATALICEQLAVRSALVDHPMTLEMTADLVARAIGPASHLVVISNDLDLAPAVRVARQRGSLITSVYLDYDSGAPTLEAYSSRHKSIALTALPNFVANDG